VFFGCRLPCLRKQVGGHMDCIAVVGDIFHGCRVLQLYFLKFSSTIAAPLTGVKIRGGVLKTSLDNVLGFELL
jgi:hypothetical protein